MHLHLPLPNEKADSQDLASQDSTPLILPDKDGRCNGERYPELPSQVLEHDLEAPSETIADTSSTPFQFTPYRTPGLPTSLFVASR